MDTRRYVNQPPMPPFYNANLIQHFEAQITGDMRISDPLEGLCQKYVALSAPVRDGEYGMALLNVLATGIEMVLADKDRGSQYFRRHKPKLTQLRNISFRLATLLKTTPPGKLEETPLRSIELTCGVCGTMTTKYCKNCRLFYFCSKNYAIINKNPI